MREIPLHGAHVSAPKLIPIAFAPHTEHLRIGIKYGYLI